MHGNRVQLRAVIITLIGFSGGLLCARNRVQWRAAMCSVIGSNCGLLCARGYGLVAGCYHHDNYLLRSNDAGKSLVS